MVSIIQNGNLKGYRRKPREQLVVLQAEVNRPEVILNVAMLRFLHRDITIMMPKGHVPDARVLNDPSLYLFAPSIATDSRLKNFRTGYSNVPGNPESTKQLFVALFPEFALDEPLRRFYENFIKNLNGNYRGNAVRSKCLFELLSLFDCTDDNKRLLQGIDIAHKVMTNIYEKTAIMQ